MRPYCLIALMIACSSWLAPAAQSAEIPTNIDGGLRKLLEGGAATPPAAAARGPATSKGPVRAAGPVTRRDDKGRVLVSITLEQGVSPDTVKAGIEAAGGAVTGIAVSGRGLVNAFVPVSSVPRVAGTKGVRAMRLSRPILRAGSVTSEGLLPLRVTQILNNPSSLKGAGITVGILSDSYARVSAQPNAAADVASNDLPTGVVVIDDTSTSGGADEGRAMAQIVHDVAPAARICFATAFNGEASFAANIRALANPNGACKANIIVDDVGYADEPIAQDGIIGEAITEVTQNGVLYFTAAGNDNGSGYRAEYNPVSFADAVAAAPSLALNSIPIGLRPDSFHNFGTSAAPVLAQTIDIDGSYLLLWDDPTLKSKLTRDFALYRFTAAGAYFDTTDDINALTDVPFEFLDASGSYRFLIGRRQVTDANPRKSVIQTLVWGGAAMRPNPQPTGPTIMGHACTLGALSTAAYFATQPAIPEAYSSRGPCIASIDNNGNRFPTVTRQKPDFAAPDGVSTTFFTPTGVPGSYRFFGTSAAAPHAAAVAALILADAPTVPIGSVDDILRRTALPHFTSTQVVPLRLGDALHGIDIRVQGAGDVHSNLFVAKLTKAPAGVSLASLQIDLRRSTFRASMLPSTTIFDAGSAAQAGQVTVTPAGSAAAKIVLLKVQPRLVTKGKSLVFGTSYSPDANPGIPIPAALAGASFTVKLTNNKTFTGVLKPAGPTAVWDANFGFGQIDATAALQRAKLLAVNILARRP
jgi:hypothetical protein